MQNRWISLLAVGAIALSGLLLFNRQLLWGYILASYYFTDQSDPYEPWDGCADPTSQAELDAWIAHSKATGEPLCDPDVVNFQFPESSEAPM